MLLIGRISSGQISGLSCPVVINVKKYTKEKIRQTIVTDILLLNILYKM